MKAIVDYHDLIEENIYFQDNFHLIDTFQIENFFLQYLMKDYWLIIEIYQKIYTMEQDNCHSDDSRESSE
jgi:hypothetical protein